MPIKLSKLLASEKANILSDWIKQIRILGGSYIQISHSELLSATRGFYDVFIEALCKGNFLKLRMHIKKISQFRSTRGFRIIEVQRAIYALYYVLKPMIEKKQASGELASDSLDKINSILVDTLFELSEEYFRRLNETIDKYIDGIEKANSKLKETSIHDELTGCYNHGYFHNILDSEIPRCKRYNRLFSIIMFDIDHFKKFNDKFGHLFGDEVLKGIANIINKSLRSSDTLFRYGGEEFAIILPETAREKAVIIAQRIRKKISSTFFNIKKTKVKITISGGVDGFQGKILDKEKLISNADNALYSAKKRGRNQVVLYA